MLTDPRRGWPRPRTRGRPCRSTCVPTGPGRRHTHNDANRRATGLAARVTSQAKLRGDAGRPAGPEQRGTDTPETSRTGPTGTARRTSQRAFVAVWMPAEFDLRSVQWCPGRRGVYRVPHARVDSGAGTAILDATQSGDQQKPAGFGFTRAGGRALPSWVDDPGRALGLITSDHPLGIDAGQRGLPRVTLCRWSSSPQVIGSATANPGPVPVHNRPPVGGTRTPAHACGQETRVLSGQCRYTTVTPTAARSAGVGPIGARVSFPVRSRHAEVGYRGAGAVLRSLPRRKPTVFPRGRLPAGGGSPRAHGAHRRSQRLPGHAGVSGVGYLVGTAFLADHPGARPAVAIQAIFDLHRVAPADLAGPRGPARRDQLGRRRRGTPGRSRPARGCARRIGHQRLFPVVRSGPVRRGAAVGAGRERNRDPRPWGARWAPCRHTTQQVLLSVFVIVAGQQLGDVGVGWAGTAGSPVA